ncbi:MAG: peptidase, partial [Pseudomonadota bacterium]
VKTRDAENELAVKTRQAEAEQVVTTKRAEAEFVAKDREAAAKERMAQAEKELISATGLAEVEVERERALAIKETGEAEAYTLQSAGEAEAQALRAKGLAEAEAQTARFEAAQQYDDHTREHDKWVMQLQQEKDLELARIDAQKTVVGANAQALGEALSKADIRLFGGEGMEQIRRTIMDAAVVDAKFNESEVLNPLVSDYVNGNRSLPQDIKDVLESTELKSSDLSNVALASLLNSQGGAAELMKKIQSSLDTTTSDKS